jgi:hypothetical protein
MTTFLQEAASRTGCMNEARLPGRTTAVHHHAKRPNECRQSCAKPTRPRRSRTDARCAGSQRTQFPCERVRVGEALFATLVERLQNDGLESWPDRRIQCRRPFRRSMPDRVHEMCDLTFGEHASPARHLEQHSTGTVDICALIDRFPQHLLGGHVRQRPYQGSAADRGSNCERVRAEQAGIRLGAAGRRASYRRLCELVGDCALRRVE